MDPETDDAVRFHVDKTRLATAAMIFAVLVLVGATLFVSGFVADTGWPLAVLGGVQTLVCSFVLGLAINRWRDPRPYLIISSKGIHTAAHDLLGWSDIRSAEVVKWNKNWHLVVHLDGQEPPVQRIELALLTTAARKEIMDLVQARLDGLE